MSRLFILLSLGLILHQNNTFAQADYSIGLQMFIDTDNNGFFDSDQESFGDLGKIVTKELVDVAIVGVASTTTTCESLGGTLFTDNNNDGCQDAGEPGVPGETVTLYECDVAGNPTSVAGTATTDADGNYTFAEGEPGAADVCLDPAVTYVVEFSTIPADTQFSTNDATGTCAVGDADDIDPSTGLTTCLDPSDNDGDEDDHVDGGVVPLGSIGSQIFIDDNNNGEFDAGEDTVGDLGKIVTVELVDAATGAVVATTTTDANGEYVFDNWLPGDYIVQFDAPASFPVSSTPTDTADNNEDNDDNGTQMDTDGDGVTDGTITSPVITLSPGTEPTGDPGIEATPDENGDNTIDFGLLGSSKVSFSQGQYAELENSSSIQFCFEVSQSPLATGIDVNVNLLSISTATNGVDYETISNPSTYYLTPGPIGLRCFQVDLIDDILVESDEQIFFEIESLSAPLYQAEIDYPSNTTLTILDNDDNDDDGIENSQDSCPDDFNPFQEDVDGDGIGDECDPQNIVSQLHEVEDNIYANKLYSGIILKDKAGECWMIVVQENGELKTISVVCP